MISGIFHSGSGIGNQLHRYAMTRVLAMDKGFDWGMYNKELFKGKDFMNLEINEPVMKPDIKYYEEKRINTKDGVDIRDYDWEGLLTIQDNTVIDGEFQGEKYFEHHLDDIRNWLKVEPLNMNDNLCIINFRGGEYRYVRDLFLPPSYWHKAVEIMYNKYIGIDFEVHTDDPETARELFPDFNIVSDIALNWRSIRHARHLILSNSSFAILPSLMNEHVREVIAPKFWAGRNVGYWKMNQNKYAKYTYI